MNEFDLRKEEYLALRQELASHMKELALLERNCVFAAAIVYAWLIKDGAKTLIADVGWYIPVLFALFGALRSLSVGRHIFTLGQYIHQIESAHLTEPNMPKGWEHFLAAPQQNPRIRTAITVSFWLVFLCITVAAGIMRSMGYFSG